MDKFPRVLSLGGDRHSNLVWKGNTTSRIKQNVDKHELKNNMSSLKGKMLPELAVLNP